MLDWAPAARAVLALDTGVLAAAPALALDATEPEVADPSGRPGVAEPVELALADDPLPALPERDWAAADGVASPLAVADAESVGEGLADVQLAVADGLALPEVLLDGPALPEAGAELDGAALDGAALDGAELDGAAVGPALGSLLGLVVRLGGRLDFGGRTLVTSLITGNGLSGSAAVPSR